MKPSEIVSIYEYSRKFYPECDYEGDKPEMQRISGLKDIILQFDLILLDAYGVLVKGGVAIPEAIEAVKLAKELGKEVRIVSNDTSKTGEDSVYKYQDLGFDFKFGEITTSLDIVEIFTEQLRGEQGLAMVAGENAKLEGFTNLYHTKGVIPKGTQAILFLQGAGWTDEFQDNLVASAGNVQYSIALGNPDVVSQASDGSLVKTPGYYMADFIEATEQEDEPVLLGKPDGVIYQTLMLDEFAEAENVLMVGDTPHTDILGGQAMGFKTLLLESGVFGKDVGKIAEDCGIIPDFIAPHL